MQIKPLIIAGIFGAALALASTGFATVYTWTGAVDGVWTNAGNWDANGVPADSVGGTGNNAGISLASGDSIVFDVAPGGAATPLPTSAIPDLGGSTAPHDTPTIVINQGGAISLKLGGREGDVWSNVSGTRNVLTVGDGTGAAGEVEVSLSSIVSNPALARHTSSTTNNFQVNADGILNFTSATLDFGYDSSRHGKITINGGEVNLSGVASDLTTYAARVIDFTATGGTFTADFGGDFSDIAAVISSLGVDFVINTVGGGLQAVDNADGTFTVSAVVVPIFQMDFNDADGNQSLVDRGTTGTTGLFSGGSTYSTTVAPNNSGGFSGSFNGSSGAVDFGDIDALDGLTQMTITAWIKSDDLNTNRIVSKRSNPDGFDLYYHNTAPTGLEFVGEGGVANGGGSFSASEWTWVAVTYDGTQTTNNVTFYTGDGTTLSAGDTASLNKGALLANAQSLLIGNNSAGSRTFDGLIDNVRIYNTVEDAASLQSIMQFDDTDLVFQMDFNDVAGNQSLVDRGTTGTTGSFGGGSTYSTDVAPVNTGGYSGSFDGASGAANFGDIDALDELSAFTMTAWVKSSTANSGGPSNSARIVSKRNASTGFELYYHDSDNELEFVANGSVANGGGSFAGQQWTWIAVTYDGSTATFYTGDGTTLSAGDSAALAKGAFAATTGELLIGNYNTGTRTYSGLIDNVRIYKTVQDTASLQAIMQYNDAANAPQGPTVTLSTAVDVVDSAYTVDVTFSADVSGLEASDFVVTNGTASGVSPATGPASTYTVTITPAALGTVTVQLPADSATDTGSLQNFASNVLNTTAIAPDGPKKPITVRVAAYNVEFGKSATPEEIGALLLPYNLDIIGFNEVPDGDWTARVGAVLGMDYTFVGAISSANHTGPAYADVTGNYDGKYKSILSRTPLEVTNEFQLTGAGWNPASAVRARTKIDGNSVAFYSLHISGNNGSTNSHAYKLATQVLPLETVDRVIVVGDFNNNIGDYNINAIENAGFEAIWTDLNIDVTQEKTYDAQDSNTSRGVIDHIFINTSASPTVTNGGIIEEVSPLSDHKPVWAVIEFPDYFQQWATTNGIDGELPGDDFDGDGLANFTEYALGRDPTAADGPAGTFDGITASYTKGADAIANGNVVYSIEESDDLGVTDPWTAVVTQAAPDASQTISYALPTGKEKVFVRLNVVEAP